METITILHNPRCSKSRQALQLLQQSEVPFKIVDYIKTPLSVEELQRVLGLLKCSPRELLRTNEAEYKNQNLADAHLTDQQLIQAMATCPRLIQRPVIIGAKRAIIARPPEKILTSFF